MRVLFSYILLFLLVFDLHIPPMQFLGSAPIVLVISLLTYAFSSKRREYSFYYILRENKYALFVLFLIFFYTSTRMVFGGESPPIFLLSVMKNIIYVVSALAYLSAFSPKNLPSMLLNIFFINSVICLVVGTYTDLLPYVFRFKGEDIESVVMWIPYRNSFLAGSGYFGIGAVYALATSFFLIYFFDSRKVSVLTVVKIFSCVVVGFIAARTSMITFLITIIFLVIVRKKYKILVGAFFLIIILFIVLSQIIEFDATQQEWLLEGFKNYDNLDKTGSGAILFGDMMVFPKTIIGLIFGDGFYSMGDLYYGETDIGYLRHWLFGGIILVLLVFMIPVALFFQNKNRTFLFLLTPLMLILHFKGVFLLNSPMGMPLLFLISFVLQQEYKKYNENEGSTHY